MVSRKLGAFLVGLGVAALVFGTYGGVSMLAERNANVDVAADPNGLLGITDETQGGSSLINQDNTTVANVTNNADVGLSATEANVLATTSDGVTEGDLVANFTSGDINAGETTEVVLRCDGTSTSANTAANVTISMSVEDTDGSLAVSIERRFDDLDLDCG